MQSLVTEANRKLLEARLTAYFGRHFRVDFEAGETDSGSTVAGAERERRAAERREMIERFKSDPLVKEVIRLFGGEVDEDSIRPADESGGH